MKKSICLYFEANQPTRLRTYRFFDIGKDSHYYDDFACRTNIHKASANCYLPMNNLLLNAINESNGAFKLAFSMPGTVIEQLDRYEPAVIDGFRKLAGSGSVEFLCETYFHSLASVVSEHEFAHQVEKHRKILNDYFGVKPETFRNTDLIYSDNIGEQVHKLGFNAILVEGAKHVLGWKSPNYLYTHDTIDSLKLLMRNYSLSDDLALRFNDRNWNEWPLTAQKYLDWIKASEGEIVNLFMDYETFNASAGNGIMEFMKDFIARAVADPEIEFVTPAQAVRNFKAVDSISVMQPESWSKEERDLSAWLGNELQQEAFNKLYGLAENLYVLNREDLWMDFGRLQESEMLYYMSTKYFSGKNAVQGVSPYDTPFEAFINYMNVLSDFIIRVNNALEEM